MSSTEKDLELKLRTMRYLWNLGYFVRRNVDLVENVYEKSRVYSDIDVLGIKLDESLNSHFIVCDCKSGIRVKTAERLFWLSGVMSYFDSREGLFIRDQMMSTKYAELSKRLKIVPISSAQLSDLERLYRIPKRFYGPFCEEQDLIDYVFSELKKHDRSVHDYVLKGYWKDPPQQQITTLMTSCQRVTNNKDLEDYQRMFALAYALSCLSLSILRLSRSILRIPERQKETMVKQELLGGTTSLSEREKLLEGFYNFMTGEIIERYKQKYPVTKREFLESLIPKYSKYFVDLTIRICQDPASAIQIPRILDLFAFESVINKRKTTLDDVVAKTRKGFSLKPIKDFLVFADRSGIITESFQQLSKEYVDYLEDNG